MGTNIPPSLKIWSYLTSSAHCMTLTSKTNFAKGWVWKQLCSNGSVMTLPEFFQSNTRSKTPFFARSEISNKSCNKSSYIVTKPICTNFDQTKDPFVCSTATTRNLIPPFVQTPSSSLKLRTRYGTYSMFV